MAPSPVTFVARFGGFMAFLTLILSSLMFALTTGWMLLPLAAIGVLIGWLVPSLFGSPTMAHHLTGGLLCSGIVGAFIAIHRKLQAPFGRRTRSGPHPSP